MPTPSSGPISLLDVQNEFGGSNPIGINEYYGVAAGVPSSGTISLYDFYGKSAVTTPFTENVFGYRVTGDSYSSSDTFNGNTITPGASNSPKTFFISATANDAPNSSSAILTYYQGGSLNTTFTDYYSANVTFTFGSSSMQFRSSIFDGNSYDNLLGETSVYWTTGYGAPSNRFLFRHQWNLTGGGYFD